MQVDQGQWLIEHRADMDRAEALWLEHLAAFDRDQLWALDGQFSCVTWLVWRANMARSTAFDKLRVAHELARRPIVAQALHEGRLSYSAARAITRLDRVDPAVDEALVALAESGEASIVDLERVVRSYRLYADQDRPPPEEADQGRDVKIPRREQDTGQAMVTLSQLELEEFAATLQAFLDLRYRNAAVNESSAEDSSFEEAPAEEAARTAQRADAFMDLVRTALAHAGEGQAAGDDRYMVHVVTRLDTAVMTLMDGAPLHPARAATLACDASRVVHTVNESGEPLNLGRKSRDWSTAQRRAVALRDGGHCRFVGCQNIHYDIHHVHPWDTGGGTDVDNGCCLCPRHHHMIHKGYRLEGNPNGELRQYRPDGSYLGGTYPVRRLVGV